MISYGPYRAIVERVHDGDTINAALDLGFDLTFHVAVRVNGINAPELITPEGKLARDFAQEALPVGSAVSVISHGWDKYGGRIDGDILIMSGVYGGRDFSELMVSSGHAVVYRVR